MDEDESDPPEQASEGAGPDSSDTPEGSEVADGDEPSGDRDAPARYRNDPAPDRNDPAPDRNDPAPDRNDPAPDRDDADTEDRASTGSAITTEPFDERAGSD